MKQLGPIILSWHSLATGDKLAIYRHLKVQYSFTICVRVSVQCKVKYVFYAPVPIS